MDRHLLNSWTKMCNILRNTKIIFAKLSGIFCTIQIPETLVNEGNQGKYMAEEGLKVSYPRKDGS